MDHPVVETNSSYSLPLCHERIILSLSDPAITYHSHLLIPLHLFLHRSSTDDVEAVSTARDIFVQEIMSLNDGEFQHEQIDMDSITFSGEKTIKI